jgi:hypothetical protein
MVFSLHKFSTRTNFPNHMICSLYLHYQNQTFSKSYGVFFTPNFLQQTVTKSSDMFYYRPRYQNQTFFKSYDIFFHLNLRQTVFKLSCSFIFIYTSTKYNSLQIIHLHSNKTFQKPMLYVQNEKQDINPKPVKVKMIGLCHRCKTVCSTFLNMQSLASL